MNTYATTSSNGHRVRPVMKSFIAAIALGLPLAIGAPASARTPVDPGSLNPPLPDFFNGVCNQLGKHVLCTLAFSDEPIIDEPSEVVCDGTEILYSQERSVVGKRTYTGAGDLLQRHFREDVTGTMSNPSTGRTLDWVAQSTIIDNLAVPGDRSTGVIQITGTAIRVLTERGRTVLNDAGRVVIDASTDEIIFSAGPHRFDDYFLHGDADALAPLCAALS